MISGLAHVLRPMRRIWNQFVLNTICVVSNEIVHDDVVCVNHDATFAA